MVSIGLNELAKLPHINVAALNGRTIVLMPVWDGSNWHHWTNTPDGQFIKIQIVDAARSNYLAKVPAREDDLHIPFVDFMWQRASWPEVTRLISGICDDFHLLATIAAKLEHFHKVRESIDQTLIDSFVKSEIELLIVVARSIFDLLQEVIAHFWNDRIRLLDPVADALRRRNKLHPKRFMRTAMVGEIPRTAEEITNLYALPLLVSSMYVKHTPFFASLREMRERIIHGGTSVDTIFVTDKGFCVDPQSNYFSGFSWKPEHYYNPNIVSLRPWIANIILRTIEACSEIMSSLAIAVPFPEPVAPGYQVFIRDPSNRALVRLLDVDQGNLVWWNEKADVGSSSDRGSAT
jgi:hypothetical protein